jgi:hypothetical protein
MNLSIGKRSLLGLVAGALMTLGVAAPAFASAQTTSGTVTVSGTDNATLVFTIDGSTSSAISFSALNQEACNAAVAPVAFHIESNMSYTGDTYVSSSTGISDIAPSQLHWARGTLAAPVAASCTANGFATTAYIAPQAPQWFTTHGATNDDSFTNSYALQVNYANTPGSVDMTITYAVAQQ